MSGIPIDESAVHDELRAIEGEYIAAGEQPPPGDQGAPGPQPEMGGPAPMDWTIPAGLVVMILDKLVAPNWELDAGEKQMLHEQTAQTLQVCFPTINLDPRWVALGSLAGAFTAVAMRRMDLETGKLKPMRAAPPEDDAERRAA
ncbi:hypothetical protein JM946_12660 [Steroidobacter sp. S1-65]|uniref:Uncharacterized protein n=1 Tax=Steroidobacter gossypii TaxID=2805490 RepID=A0ABS1WXA5_9GAMM|nr:hypothetical protein [Steroidobacter gossypii]MBM0105610.1 hypothetical protein [Steroidobacter gossypii]